MPGHGSKKKQQLQAPKAPPLPMPKVVTKILAGGADPNVEAEQAPVKGDWQRIPFNGSTTSSSSTSAFSSSSTSSSIPSSATGSFFSRLFITLYGEMAPRDLLRVSWFAGTLFFIIGGYWLLRSLKDSVMVAVNGVEYIPQAKMVSLLVVTALVFAYNKLLDLVPKHQLFYYVGLFYFCIFSGIAFMLASPTHGLANTKADPSRLLGWFSYCAIESFGSIGVSLFWAFVNSTIDLEGAKKAYGLIIAGAQVGSILGPTLVIRAHSIGLPTLYFCGALCMLLMVVSVFLYVQQFGVEVEEEKSSNKKKGSKAGVMEGFHLFMQHGYVRGIFALSCLFMVEVTILDYMMKVLAKRHFTALYPSDPLLVTDEFASFMGLFGQITNGISFVFSLTGTSFVIRRLGLYRSLVAFPILCMVAIAVAVMVPDLWVVFACMMFLKALSYSLNNPCKEMLYQPTSTGIKFKSKSWIDIFGQRGAKAAGSVVTNALSDSVHSLVLYGGLVSVFISAFLIWVAAWMGTRFEEYTQSGFVVGAEEGEEGWRKEGGGGGGLKGVRVEEEGMRGGEAEMSSLAAVQNVRLDTSCGILEEGGTTQGGGEGEHEEGGEEEETKSNVGGRKR